MGCASRAAGREGGHAHAGGPSGWHRRERKTLSLLTRLPAVSRFRDVTEDEGVVWAAQALEGRLGCVYSVTRPITAVVTCAQVTCLCVFVPKAPRVRQRRSQRDAGTARPSRRPAAALGSRWHASYVLCDCPREGGPCLLLRQTQRLPRGPHARGDAGEAAFSSEHSEPQPPAAHGGDDTCEGGGCAARVVCTLCSGEPLAPCAAVAPFQSGVGAFWIVITSFVGHTRLSS